MRKMENANTVIVKDPSCCIPDKLFITDQHEKQAAYTVMILRFIAFTVLGELFSNFGRNAHLKSHSGLP